MLCFHENNNALCTSRYIIFTVHLVEMRRIISKTNISWVKPHFSPNLLTHHKPIYSVPVFLGGRSVAHPLTEIKMRKTHYVSWYVVLWGKKRNMMIVAFGVFGGFFFITHPDRSYEAITASTSQVLKKWVPYPQYKMGMMGVGRGI